MYTHTSITKTNVNEQKPSEGPSTLDGVLKNDEREEN